MSRDTPDGDGSPEPPPAETDTVDGERSLRVGDALAEGAARVGRPGGLLLLAGYLFIGLAGAVGRESLFAALAPRLREAARTNPSISPADLPALADSPLALSTTPRAALAMVLLTALLAEVLNVVAVRTFVRDATAVPGEVFEGVAARTSASFVANVLARVAVFAGLLAFVLPGLLLAAGFYLVRPVIAVEGSGVLAGLRRSWRLTAGSRLRVLLVLLIVFLVSQAAALPAAVLGAAGAGAVAGAGLGVALGAVAATFGTAAAARVYVQLAGAAAASTADDDRDTDDATTTDTADTKEQEEPLGALSPEEIDERFGDDRS